MEEKDMKKDNAQNAQKDTQNVSKVQTRMDKQSKQKHDKKLATGDKKQKENVKLHKNEERTRNHKGAVIGLTIATSILGATTLGFGIAYGCVQAQANNYAVQLENIYKKNYYELVDNVNSADTQISKLLASNDESYQAKMLTEVANSSKEMQNNIASLPLSGENIIDCVRFINQMSGYTQTLEEKLVQGGTLTENDIQTLNDMHDTLTEMKRFLNQMSNQMVEGYNILGASSHRNGELDEFSLQFAQIRTEEADYPTMIYDGPFSDSVVNQKIKGLSGNEISKEEAYTKVDETFKNISNLSYSGQTNGRFDTYNFVLLNSDNQKIYVQATKIGGHILSVSGNVESQNKQISSEQAEKIALNFATESGVENATVVWSEELENQSYFNIAPQQDGVILYPDLVKVKVDMEHGDVIGFDAITYWTNHTQRNLDKTSITKETAKANIDESFTLKGERLVLAPLEYNREELCWEFECERNGSTYYIYINATTGVEENILKVVKTTDGSKLM